MSSQSTSETGSGCATRMSYQRKYFALKRRAEQMQQRNEKLVNRIHYVKKFLRKLRRERRFLMTRLDGYGDDFRTAARNFPLEDVDLDDKEQLANAIGSGKLPTTKSEDMKPLVKTEMPPPQKRPANAFFMFCQQQRPLLQESWMKTHAGEVNNQELTKELAAKWNNLTTREKNVYYRMYERDRQVLDKR